MIEPEIALADLSDNAALAEALLKYTFAALLNEREEDLAFFDQRIEKGLVAKLEGIVGSEFVHMGDYGDGLLNRKRRWLFGRSPAPPAGASLISLSTRWASRDRCGGNCGLTIAGTGPQFLLSRRRSGSYYLIP